MNKITISKPSLTPINRYDIITLAERCRTDNPEQQRYSFYKIGLYIFLVTYIFIIVIVNNEIPTLNTRKSVGKYVLFKKKCG